MSKCSRKEARQQRHRRLRRSLSGTAERPRLAVCRSANHIYVQIIDDTRQHTLAAVSTVEKQFRERELRPNVAGATELGRIIAERAAAANIRQVVFDRGGLSYHGRIKALADAARTAGLEF